MHLSFGNDTLECVFEHAARARLSGEHICPGSGKAFDKIRFHLAARLARSVRLGFDLQLVDPWKWRKRVFAHRRGVGIE